MYKVQTAFTLPLVTMHNGTRAVARGRAELQAGAAVDTIGVGSPVARLGADWRRRRESRAADVGAVGAVDAVCVLGAGAAVVAEGVGGVERHPLARSPKGS